MSTTTLNLRASLERLSVIALYVATASTVAGGAVAMCFRPVAG